MNDCRWLDTFFWFCCCEEESSNTSLRSPYLCALPWEELDVCCVLRESIRDLCCCLLYDNGGCISAVFTRVGRGDQLRIARS
eukprot:jgi/Botrbrau1/113/Bobra.0022s0101.1